MLLFETLLKFLGWWVPPAFKKYPIKKEAWVLPALRVIPPEKHISLFGLGAYPGFKFNSV